MNEHEHEGAWVDELAAMPDSSTEAYALPELPRAEVAELEAATAEQVLTVRDEGSLLIANLGNDQLPHFLATVEGREVCGTDGQPWPCSTWLGEIEPQAVAHSEGLGAVPVTYTAAEVAMAAEQGITAAEVRERMRAR